MDYQLYHGDCLEIMPTLEAGSVDAIIADWPYGTTACKWDSIIPLEPLWKECKRVIKRNGAIVLFGSEPFTSTLIISNMPWFKYKLIWDKGRGYGPGLAKYRPLPSFEELLIFGQRKIAFNPQLSQGEPYQKTNGKYQPHGKNGHNLGYKPGYVSTNDGFRYPLSVLRFSWSPSVTLHPTQKPLALLEYLVKTYTNPGDLVLDNTFGSCTTGEACLRTGRRFIGIEKDAEYFRIGQERMERVKAELSAMLPNFQMIGA